MNSLITIDEIISTDRVKHYGLHFAKYVGRLARDRRTETTKTDFGNFVDHLINWDHVARHVEIGSILHTDEAGAYEGNVKHHTLTRLESLVGAVTGKRLRGNCACQMSDCGKV